MSESVLEPRSTPGGVPITPSAEAWRGMSAAAKERFLEEVIAALQREAELMPEGRPHSVAKMSAANTLSDFYDRIGRRVYLACELPVAYPGEPVFAPDLLAVADVEDPGHRDQRMGWVVADEGRGIDLALEILHAGDRQKDLVENVARFARLEIPEYFVYDRKNQRLFGYFLPIPEARRYQRIASRRGKLRSRVLGLDLAVVGGRLRFFYGDAEVPESRELIAQLEGMMAEREAEVAAKETEIADRERALEMERAAKEAERAAKEAERAARIAAEAHRDALEREIAELRRRLGE